MLPTCYLVSAMTFSHFYRVSGSVIHSRQKRFIAFNYDEMRITLPPGTIFFLTPTLNVPFIRNLKKGFDSKLTISAPFQSE